MAKGAFGGKGRPPAPTSAFGKARPRKPAMGAALGALPAGASGPMPGSLPVGPPGAGIGPGAPGAAFSHGGGVQGGSMRGYKTTASAHDCPALGGASKHATTVALCRGGKS
jgi:hypothetical protein